MDDVENSRAKCYFLAYILIRLFNDFLYLIHRNIMPKFSFMSNYLILEIMEITIQPLQSQNLSIKT